MVYNSVQNKNKGEIMELSHISNTNFDTVNYKSNVQPSQLKIEPTTIQNTNKLQNIDFYKQSDFSNTLTNNINNISSIQTQQSKINTQIDIVNSINTNMSTATTPMALDSIQPTVNNLIQVFNTNAMDMNTEEGGSHTFFDGKLGSKPLSSSDVSEAMQNQLALLTQARSTNTQVLDTIVKEVKQNFTKEKEVVSSRAESQTIDFGKESSDFTSTTLSNVSGSIVSAQANATQSQAIRLLKN